MLALYLRGQPPWRSSRDRRKEGKAKRDPRAGGSRLCHYRRGEGIGQLSAPCLRGQEKERGPTSEKKRKKENRKGEQPHAPAPSPKERELPVADFFKRKREGKERG